MCNSRIHCAMGGRRPLTRVVTAASARRLISLIVSRATVWFSCISGLRLRIYDLPWIFGNI